MDDFFKNLKNRFSFDNIVTFMKDARLVDEARESPSANSDNIVAGKSRNQMIDVDGAPIVINDKEGSDVNSSKNTISDKSGFNVLKKSSSDKVKSDPDSTKSETSEKPVKTSVEIPLYF